MVRSGPSPARALTPPTPSLPPPPSPPHRESPHSPNPLSPAPFLPPSPGERGLQESIFLVFLPPLPVRGGGRGRERRAGEVRAPTAAPPPAARGCRDGLRSGTAPRPPPPPPLGRGA